jgi:sterol desaturase/sphingolipid hydroxylase (fatty acid hydroxylase superfamily)
MPSSFIKSLLLSQPVWYYGIAMAFTAAWIVTTTTWTRNLLAIVFIWGPTNWTLQEYMIHRFVLHGSSTMALMHGKHHDKPHDLKRVFVPMGLTIALAAGHYVPLWLLWGREIGLANLLSQFICYACFEWVHYDCHVIRSRLLRGPRRFHTIHHGNTGVNYGFTSASWDLVFGTCDDTHRPWWPILCIPLPLFPLLFCCVESVVGEKYPD